ncbi:MAG: trypsin-like peptidase domain-containing protein [Verrucomicrobiales bacterium]|nr:trypsin-like peptidase domain-containing protein [Verrucomicrobiales bacterium]
MNLRLLPVSFLLCPAVLMLHAPAQAPGIPIEEPKPADQMETISPQAAKLLKDGKLKNDKFFASALQKPTPEKFTLPAQQTKRLSPGEIWEAARNSRMLVGWYYLCKKCDHWHTSLAGGYPLTEDGVISTCHHVVEAPETMREGYLIAVDAAGRVRPVASVLAKSKTMDACILRTEGEKLVPLALTDNVRPGDSAFCLSNPMQISGYFSEGIVNRFYWRSGVRGKPGSLDEVKHLRMNVSTDWAQGSSGSPLLDACGNVIGHVSVISQLGQIGAGKGRTGGSAQIVLHEATPSRGVMALAAEANRQAGDAARPAVPSAEDAAEAIAKGNVSEAVRMLEALEKAGGNPGEWQSLSFRLAVKTQNADSAMKFASMLADGPAKGNPAALNEVAWALVTDLEKPAEPVLAAAHRIATLSVGGFSGKDPASLDTLARILFLQGKKDEAVTTQKDAVEKASLALREELNRTLQAYQKGELPPAK